MTVFGNLYLLFSGKNNMIEKLLKMVNIGN